MIRACLLAVLLSLPALAQETGLADLVRRAEAGDTSAQLDLVAEHLNLERSGFAHPATLKPARDDAAARHWLDRALAAGDPWAIYAEAWLQSSAMQTKKLDPALFPVDDTKAIARYEEAARAGVLMAMSALLVAYDKGTHGLEKDAAKGLYWRAEFDRAKQEPGVAAEFRRRLSAVAAARPAASPSAIAAENKRAALALFYDANAVPGLDEKGREGYRAWLTKTLPRAFAIADGGAWFSTWGTPEEKTLPADATERAMFRCARAGKTGCRIYAVDSAVVLKGEPAKP